MNEWREKKLFRFFFLFALLRFVVVWIDFIRGKQQSDSIWIGFNEISVATPVSFVVINKLIDVRFCAYPEIAHKHTHTYKKNIIPTDNSLVYLYCAINCVTFMARIFSPSVPLSRPLAISFFAHVPFNYTANNDKRNVIIEN